MDERIPQETLDKLTKVCICKAISRAKIKEAIKNGADTIEKVAEVTGATTGGCRGRRCREKIEDLIKESK